MRDFPQFSLRDSLNVLYRQATLFKVIILLLPLATLAASLMARPVYESTARIMVTAKKEPSTLLQYPSVAGASLNVDFNVDARDLNAEMEILTCRDLWTSTVESLGLEFFDYPRPGMVGNAIAAMTRSVNGVFGKSDSAGKTDREKRIRSGEIVDYLLKNFKVTAAAQSKSLDLALRYPDPAKAAVIMRKLLTLYTPYHITVYSLPGAKAFFEKQVQTYKEKFDATTNELADFNRQAGLYLPEQQKAALIGQMEKARNSLIDVTNNLAQYNRMLSVLAKGNLPSGQLAPSTERGGENTFLTILASQLLQAEQKSWQSQETCSPGTVDSRLTSGLLKELRGHFENAIRVEREVVLAKKESLEKSLSQLAKSLEQLAESSERAKRLDLAVTISKQRYLQYLSKEEEAHIENLKGGHRLLAVSVIETPTEPNDAIFPKTRLYVLTAFLLAIPVGIGLVLLADFFDHAFYSPAQLEQVTGLPVLASLDKVSKTSLEDFWAHSRRA